MPEQNHYAQNMITENSRIITGERASHGPHFVHNPKKPRQAQVAKASETMRSVSESDCGNPCIRSRSRSSSNSSKNRCTFLITLIIFALAGLSGYAVELNVARQGEIRNVPVESPYNGCLLVREGPNMESPIKGHVTNGSTVQIEGAAGSWYKISSPLNGYIWASYVTVTDSQTVDTSNMTKALDLETIVENANPWTREENLPARQKLLEDNDTATPPELPAAP